MYKEGSSFFQVWVDDLSKHLHTFFAILKMAYIAATSKI